MPSPETDTEEDRYFITALSRGLDVLACFHSGDAALSNQQISQRCGLPKSTVTRIAYTLTKRGYLIQTEPGGKYALGSATLALGSSMLARMDIRQLARPLMQELADFAGATVALGVRDRFSLIYIEVCRSTATLALTLQVGSRIPLATSAIGRAFLASAAQEERNAIMDLAGAGDPSTAVALRDGLIKGLQDYRDYGCATSFGEWQSDVSGIALGLRSTPTMPALAINCGGPSSSLSKEYLLTEVKPRLAALVAKLESASFT